MTAEITELRSTVAVACRVLANELGPGAGHVSARVPGTDEMWLRCRGGRSENGLVGTDLHHIRRVSFDGDGPGLGPTHFAPHETPLHGEVYRARPDVGAVVHVHPRYALLCSIAGIEFKPVIGGFAPQLARIAILGVPEYRRAATVIDKEMAADMIAAMGDRDIVLLQGHGIAATGATVEAATASALRFETLCELMWQLTLSGRPLREITKADFDRYDPRNPNRVQFEATRDWQGTRRQGARQGGGGDEEGGGTGWAGYVRHLEATIGLPDESMEPSDLT